MPSPPDAEAWSRLAELLGEIVRDKEETQRLLSAFGRGEIGRDEIVNELAARYQTGIGGAVRALAEHNKDAAQQLGQRLRSRIDAFLNELAGEARPAADAAGRSQPAEVFRDREDEVILREYVILKALAERNADARSSSIFKAVRTLEPAASDEVVTAHLARMVKAGILGRERKGRYHGIAQSRVHLEALRAEIESRRLRLPAVPTIE